MKTLILNGSPRVNGDTAALLKEFKAHKDGEIIELSAYRDDISPCLDCRFCREHPECAIKDDMQTVYDDNYDALVVASPVYFGALTGKLMSLMSRLQIHHMADFVHREPIKVKPKTGIIMLAGGGNKNYDGAIRMARTAHKLLGVKKVYGNIVIARHTDTIPACDDEDALKEAREAAIWLNNETCG